MPESFVYMNRDAIAADAVRPKAGVSSRTDKLLRRFLLILGIILGAELCWMFVLSPCMPLSSIEVSGIPGIGREYIIEHAGITSSTSYFNMDTEKAKKALANLPMVESAEITRSFPGTLHISLKPRVPVAISLTYIDGKMTPLFIDKSGVICRIGISGPDSKVMVSTLPIISGLIFENPGVGTRLPPAFKGVLESLDRIGRKDPVLLSSISEIRIEKKLYDGFELVLYPAHSNIKIRTGSVLNEEMVKYMMLVIDVLHQQGTDVDEIDFRTGTAAYKTKEARSG